MALPEAYHVSIGRHNAMGPLQVLAGAHTMMTVPNLYRLEHTIANSSNYNAFIDHPLAFRGDQLFLSDRPGLGVDFDVGGWKRIKSTADLEPNPDS